MDLSRYRTLFLDEARRLVANGEAMIATEQALADNGPALFRCFHTIKGMAATMQHPPITLLAHALEDVCDGLVKQTLPRDETTIGLLGEGFNALRRQLRAVEDGDEPSFEAEFEQRLRDYLKAGGTTGFTLLVPSSEEAPTGQDEAPAGLRMDHSIAAIAELMSACARLRDNVGESGAVEVNRIEDAARAIYRELVELRQVRFVTVVPALRRQMRHVAQRHGRQARLEVAGEDILVDQAVLGAMQSALVHLVHNAIIHGIEAPEARQEAGKSGVGRIGITAERVGHDLVVTFTDDGHGFDTRALRVAAGDDEGHPVDIAFRQGITTAGALDHLAGRGVGLPVVRSVVEGLGGRLAVTSTPGRGTKFRLEVPISADLVKLLVVEAGGENWAIPEHRVQPGECTVACVPLLGLAVTGNIHVLLASGEGIAVDRVVGHTEGLVSPPPFPLNRLPCVKGTTVAPDGRILFVVEP